MSKELIERLREKTVGVYSVFELHDEAADALEAQQSWIASLEQNARDADRLYKELEAAYKLQTEANELLIEQSRQLAASQAQLKVMRDAPERFTKAFDDGEDTSDYWTWNAHANRMKEALNQPIDDSALREMLKAERERAAKVIESQDVDPSFKHRMADAIRAMEDQ